MTAPVVIDTETERRYELEPTPIGEGATAKTWKGLDPTDIKAAPVAVKIARSDTRADLLVQFWDELSILERLQRTDAKESVVWAHKGKLADGTPGDIIVMEYIPREWQLSYAPRTPDGRFQEALALEVGIAYARLLSAAHRVSIASRGDRKSGDLYWDANHKRLVVLDWNRAGDMPRPTDASQSKKSLREEAIRQDIRIFGQVWAELLLGRRVDALPALDDVTDPAWAVLSRGWRSILMQARDARETWGYHTADELLQDLLTHQARLAVAAEAPGNLLDKAQSEVAESRRATDPVAQARHAEEALTWLDLAERTSGQATVSPKLTAVKEEASQFASLATVEAAEAVKRIRAALNVFNDQRAYDTAVEALRRLSGSDLAMRRAALRIERWAIVARVGISAARARAENFRPAVDLLTQLVETLEDPATQNDKTVLTGESTTLSQAENNVSDGFREEFRQLIQPIAMELEIRDLVAAAQAETVDTAHVATQYADAVARWQDLARVRSDYAQKLRADIGALDAQISQAQAEKGLAVSVEEARETFAATVNALRQEFQRADDGWPDVGKLCLDSRDAFNTLAKQDAATDEEQADYAFVSHALYVDDLLTLGYTEPALDHLRQRTDAPLSEDDRALLLAGCQRAILASLRTLCLEDGWRWPDQLNDTERMLGRLTPIAPPVLGLASEVQSYVEEWKACFTQYRQALAKTLAPSDAPTSDTPLPFPDDPQVALAALDNHQVDDILDAAGNVQLFSRKPLSDDQAGPLSNQHLLRMRQAHRLSDDLKRLQQQISFTQAEMDAPAATLTARLDALNDSLHTHQSLFEQSQQIGESLTDVEHNLARIETARKALEEIDRQRDQLRRSAEKLEDDARAYVQKVTFAQASIERLKESETELHKSNDAFSQALDTALQFHRKAEDAQRKTQEAAGRLNRAIEQVKRDEAVIQETETKTEVLDRRLTELDKQLTDIDQRRQAYEDRCRQLETVLHSLTAPDSTRVDRPVTLSSDSWVSEELERQVTTRVASKTQALERRMDGLAQELSELRGSLNGQARVAARDQVAAPAPGVVHPYAAEASRRGASRAKPTVQQLESSGSKLGKIWNDYRVYFIVTPIVLAAVVILVFAILHFVLKVL